MLKRLLLLILIPIFLCSCSSKNSSEITFASWGSITEVQVLSRVISEFEKENPDVTINFIHIPQNYFQKLHLLFASSQAPDVLFINNLYLPLYASHLEDLSNKVDAKDFFSQGLEALSIEGKLYAVPRDISTLVFYYNKDLVELPSASWTFGDFIHTLENTKGTYAVSFERDIYWAMPYVLTLGECEGIKFYKNLEGKYAPAPSQIGSSTLAQMFLDGKIALYLSGRWMYPKISEKAEFPFGIVNFPGKVPADASGWAISKDSKHKEEALRFIQFLSSKEDYFTQTGLIVPARKDSARIMKDGEAFLKAVDNSEVIPVSKDYKRITDRKNKELFN